MVELIKKLEAEGIIPVVKIERAEDAVPLAASLRRGGINCAEITFRTPCAARAISLIREAFPDMLIGAGTVLTPMQADNAMKAGADFIVSPGLNPLVVGHCNNEGYPIIPGVCTPSEVEQAMMLGLTFVKFFPAEAAGGVKMIKAMSAPYGGLRFMPTGGISPENLGEYLSCKAVFACGGSWLVPSDAVSKGDFAKIEKLTAEAVKLLGDIRSAK